MLIHWFQSPLNTLGMAENAVFQNMNQPNDLMIQIYSLFFIWTDVQILVVLK